MSVKVVRGDFFPIRADGWGVYINPPDQTLNIEGEGPIGFGTDVLFGLLGWMGKTGWQTVKVDEQIEISQNDKQYYDLVIGQKQQLEGSIKQGLGQAATAVGDYELLLHDERKLREYLDYFNNIKKYEKELAEAKEKNDETKIKKAMQGLKNAEIQVKQIFIDQVDIHTGQSAMVQAVQRWPTIIVDFQSITKFDLADNGDVSKGEEKDFSKKIGERLGVSTAEGLVLAVKQKLYEEWKKLFLESLVERYTRIKQLVEGRRKSVDQYREWLKPHIARHKMIKEGFSDIGNAAGSLGNPFSTIGTASATHEMKVWCWKRIPQIDYHKESRPRLEKEFLVDPFDHLVKAVCFGGSIDKEFDYKGYEMEYEIDKKTNELKGIKYKKDEKGNKIEIKTKDGKTPKNDSLLTAYPGLTPEQIFKWVTEIKDGSIKNAKPDSTDSGSKKWGPLDPDIFYYNMIELKLERYISRNPSGQSESPAFSLKTFFMSQNMMLVKLLEIKGQEWDFQQHVDEMLGLTAKDKGGAPMSINDIMKREYPDLFEKKPDSNNPPQGSGFAFGEVFIQPFRDTISTSIKSVTDTFSSIGFEITSFLKKFGIDIENSWTKGRAGPYEAAFKDRVTTTYLKAIGGMSGEVKGKLQSLLGM